MLYMKTMGIPLCCSSKSCISPFYADYKLMADNTLFWPIIDLSAGTFKGLAPETTESNIYGYQEIVIVVYVLSNDILV